VTCPHHLQVDVKHNETSHLTALLQPLELAGAVVTADALHTVPANPDWLVTGKKAHYIAIVKRNQPLLHTQIRALPWQQVPAGTRTREKGHAGAKNSWTGKNTDPTESEEHLNAVA
jgi:predicted transposase YbfD/YdcC